MKMRNFLASAVAVLALCVVQNGHAWTHKIMSDKEGKTRWKLSYYEPTCDPEHATSEPGATTWSKDIGVCALTTAEGWIAMPLKNEDGSDAYVMNDKGEQVRQYGPETHDTYRPAEGDVFRGTATFFIEMKPKVKKQ